MDKASTDAYFNSSWQWQFIADRGTWVDRDKWNVVAFLEVSRKMKHLHFGAKQGFFKDANSALVCTQQRNEMGACEDLFLVNIPFIIFTCKLGNI